LISVKNRFGVIVFLFCSIAVHGQSDSVSFASKFYLQSQFGLGLYGDSEDLIDIRIKYFDNTVMISISEHLCIGLHYNYISTKNRFTNDHVNFYRVGPLLQWNISPSHSNLKYYLQSMVDYGNFVIEPDDKLNKRNVIYLGLKFSIEFKIIERLYGTGGYKVIRQLERGDFGLENYPFIGLTYEFTK